MAPMEEFDVVIVGAGVSGVGAACRLRERCPGTSFVVLERRQRCGGTWDLFQFPGIRSDSFLYTYAFPFRPWVRGFASGPEIREYVEETAEACGVGPHLRFGEDVQAAAFDTRSATWRVTTSCRTYACRFLFLGAGYYDYDPPYTPVWEGMETFRGKIVHPQQWPKMDVSKKRVAVVGSGATAATIVPALARETREPVVMVQRSPSYYGGKPTKGSVWLAWLRPVLPAAAFFLLQRWVHAVVDLWRLQVCKQKPDLVRNVLLNLTAQKLGVSRSSPEFRHFDPKYNVWDQRVCAIPDFDLLTDVRDGRVRMVTGEIARFTPGGLALKDGTELPCDVVVTATGMNLHKNWPLGTIRVTVDGKAVVACEQVMLKGCMLSGVPNCVFAFGYLTASWTLKSDLTALFFTRLVKHMKDSGARICVPKRPDGPVSAPHDFSSGYLKRAEPTMPRQGTGLWARHENFLLDFLRLRLQSVREGVDMDGAEPAQHQLLHAAVGLALAGSEAAVRFTAATARRLGNALGS